MPRRKRIPSPTGVYHWINRGVNQKKIFHVNKDYDFFLGLLAEHKDPLGIQIYHYCLMSNHVHLLLWADSPQVLAAFSQYVQRRYAYYYCKVYHWKGQVFQRMYKSLPIDKDTYLLECGRYIERNPLRAHMVERVEQYPYSSYFYYNTQPPSNSVITPSPAYLGLSDFQEERQELYANYVSSGRAYEDLVDSALLKS